jgi:DNA-binding beta-propeller fold protein YncE
MSARLGTALVVALVVCGCGSNKALLAPAPEPPGSPPPAASPAGTVTAVGNQPEGLVVDQSGEPVVAVRDPASLAIVDQRGTEVIRHAAVAAPARHLALAGSGVVLVPAEAANRLIAIDPRTAQTLASVVVGTSPHDAADVAGRWFATDEFGDSVSVVQGGREVGRIPVAVQPGGIAAAADQVFVVSVRARRLESFDARALRPLHSTAGAVGPTHAVCDGRLCFVTDTEGGALLVYSLSPQPVLVGRLPLAGGPYGVALDAARARLWVTLPALNQVVELASGRQPAVLGRFATVRQPNSVAVDTRTGRVFVAGRSDGVLETINP